jgi:hypothetical protein
MWLSLQPKSHGARKKQTLPGWATFIRSIDHHILYSSRSSASRMYTACGILLFLRQFSCPGQLFRIKVHALRDCTSHTHHLTYKELLSLPSPAFFHAFCRHTLTG